MAGTDSAKTHAKTQAIVSLVSCSWIVVTVTEYVLVTGPAAKSASTAWNGLLNLKVKIYRKGVAKAKPLPASEACLANPCMLIAADEFPPVTFTKVTADPGGVQVCAGAGAAAQLPGPPTPAKTVCM
jgi:hypothetical protein